MKQKKVYFFSEVSSLIHLHVFGEGKEQYNTDTHTTHTHTHAPHHFPLTCSIHSISPVDALYSYLARDTDEGVPLLLDGGSWPLPLIMERVLPVLSKGLGKRVRLLALQPFNTAQVKNLCCTTHYTYSTYSTYV